MLLGDQFPPFRASRHSAPTQGIPRLVFSLFIRFPSSVHPLLLKRSLTSTFIISLLPYTMEEVVLGCAQNADGSLRDASDIKWYNDADEHPISGPSSSSASGSAASLHPIFTKGVRPLDKVGGVGCKWFVLPDFQASNLCSSIIPHAPPSVEWLATTWLSRALHWRLSTGSGVWLKYFNG